MVDRALRPAQAVGGGWRVAAPTARPRAGSDESAMNISGHMQLLKNQSPRLTRRLVSNDMAWDMMPRTVDRRQQGLPSLGPATLP